MVEIERADVIRLSGPNATVKTVGRRLLNKTCTQRTALDLQAASLDALECSEICEQYRWHSDEIDVSDERRGVGR
ncbi:hypothetical protein [Rhodopseudomonas sp.]|uniref:hypothetical protein n=1 Tax=Rhodopseudomonas sp. TaxID=1078 RepID=UPI0039E318CB